ncbi:MAG TPA: TIR domain-containing protein, partial [Kofleriaceae bacterium]
MALTAAVAPSHDLFVLHAASDAGFVHGYLLPALNLAPERVQTVESLPLGGVLVSELERAVSCSRYTAIVLSPACLSDHAACFGEQLATHLSLCEARVIPLRLSDCEIPLRLDARTALDFTDRAAWDAHVARLRWQLGAAPPPTEQIPCPYPGMRPFAEHDAGIFFGRGAEIEDLLGRLDRGEREIYVIGPSGSGKSSLVQAGVLPILTAGTSRLGRSFAVRTMRPGERPADRLARALASDPPAPSAPGASPAARLASPPDERVLVFIDQLEELFTLA